MAVIWNNSLPPYTSFSKTEGRPYRAGLLAVALILSLPVLAVRHPPLVDYPNHLARAYILAHYHDTAVFRQNYELRLEPVPNVALDLVLPFLLHVLDVNIAGRGFLVITILLFVAGCHLLGKTVHGRPTWLALPCAFFVYCTEFLWGFMNFVFGLALFLICLALWLRWRASWTPLRLVLLSLLVTSTYFAHLMDYALTALAITVMTLWYWREKEIRVGAAVLDLLPVLPPAAIFAVYMQRGGSLGSLEWDTLTRKAAAIAAFVLTYHKLTDAALVAGFLAIIVVVVCRSQRVRVFTPLLVCGLVSLLFYLFMPYRLFTGTDADNRFVPAAMLVVLLSISLDLPPRSARWIMISWLTLSMIRLGAIWSTWRGLDQRIAAMIDVLGAFPRGSRIYPAVCMECENRTEHSLHHVILYATIYRDAFVPSLLALESQEMIHFRHPANLVEPGKPGWIDQVKSYDYIWSYVIPSAAQQDLARCCELILQGNGFAIWKVPKCGTSDKSSGWCPDAEVR